MRLEGEDLYLDDLPQLDPIVAHEQTEDGWRALTANGEVLKVSSANGHTVLAPSGADIVVMQQGRAVGRRAISNDPNIDINRYLMHFDRAAALFRNNQNDEALMEAEAAVAVAPTVRARFNRAFMLLSAGYWPEGFAEYERCERAPPFQRPLSREATELGITPWRGEDLAGKRLLLLHDHGLGDSIMCLRYLPVLKAMRADVKMIVPDALTRLAARVGTVSANSLRVIDADFYSDLLHLPGWLGVTPDSVGRGPIGPYLPADFMHLETTPRKKIGIAWSVGKVYQDDYPREIALADLVAALPDAELYSVQLQGAAEAMALGVHTHQFKDLAECAALMMGLDEIVTVDTAAAHLAGAIGHPKITLLLSHWHSWRWRGNWYPGMRICTQRAPGDWASALAQMGQA